MTRWIPLVILAGLWLSADCNAGRIEIPKAASAAELPQEFTKGEAAYHQYCAACHGKTAAGTDLGPSFINRIYEPNHHPDQAFLFAARMGVRAHHWKFGDMPKIAGVSDDEIKQIIGYVRWLQRQAGIK
jgi:mono/diheme cytochrome c family protein